MGNHHVDPLQKKKEEMQEDVREWEKPGTFACAFVSLIQFQRNATGRPKKRLSHRASPPPLALLFHSRNGNVLECSMPPFSTTWMGPLVFHTKVSFRARGQATKTASTAGLEPINISAHNRAWQLHRPHVDPRWCCMPSPRTGALKLKCPGRGGESFSSLMGNVATSHHVNV